jgi:Major capsid protein N-terminus
MVASLLRVLHSGAQDSRLLPIRGQPRPEFFKTVFRRAGRFTTQWVRLDFDSRPLFGQQATLTIPRKGHLLTRLYLVTTLPNIKQYEAAAQAQPIPDIPYTAIYSPNVTVEGTLFTKTGPTNATWDAGAFSDRKYLTPCYTEFQIANITKPFFVGLSYNDSVTGDFRSSTYNLYGDGTGNVYFVLNRYYNEFTAAFFSFCGPSDLLRIEFDGRSMNFYKNGNRLRQFAAQYPGTVELKLQICLRDIGSSVNILHFTPIREFVGPHYNWTNNLGHAILDEAAIDIGGSRAETVDGRLLEVLDEFYTPLEKTTVTNALLKRYDNGYSINTLPASPQTVVTPLPFWFSRGDSGAALPVDAIQADLVRLAVTFAPVASLYISDARQAYTPTAAVPAGSAYFPLLGGQFYTTNPVGAPVFGLTGDPAVATTVSPVEGVQVPDRLDLGDTYVMAEYIYLDRPEANRFRISDITIPITQHYSFEPFDTRGFGHVQIPLRVPNPARALFFYLQRYDCAALNTPFLATRDLSGAGVLQAPWWPDASGLNTYYIRELVPAFAGRRSEPLAEISFVYEGKYVRYKGAPSTFRSFLPSLEMRKSPWVNRYMYCLPFGYNQGQIAPSLPSGEANLDKMRDIYLNLAMHARTGSLAANDCDAFLVRIWAETYNILRIYGGRAGLMFGY